MKIPPATEYTLRRIAMAGVVFLLIGIAARGWSPWLGYMFDALFVICVFGAGIAMIVYELFPQKLGQNANAKDCVRRIVGV